MKLLKTLLVSSLITICSLDLAAQQQKPSKSSSSDQLDWCETYSESMQRSKSSSKPMLILFTGTTWCPACMKLEKEVIKNPSFAQAVSEKFVFYKAEFSSPKPQDISSSPDQFLMERYNITQFPTMVVTDPNGKQLFKVDYKPGGASAYINELNMKLSSTK